MKTPEEIKKGLETCIGECTGNKPHCPYHTCGDGCMDSMNRDSRAYIRQLEAQVPKWISVAEKLPDGEVLAANFAPGTLGYTEYIIGYVSAVKCTEPDWHRDKCYATNDHEILDEVTHWMPLPSMEGRL